MTRRMPESFSVHCTCSSILQGDHRTATKAIREEAAGEGVSVQFLKGVQKELRPMPATDEKIPQ